MINNIIELLKSNEKLAGWKIHETSTISEELFFIEDKIDMNRSKRVKYFHISVYVDILEEDETFTGIASGRIHPSMKPEEVKEAIEDIVFSASFAKNKAFKIVENSDNSIVADVTDLENANLAQTVDNITKEIYSNNIEGSKLNSVEVFANKTYYRIVNSNGVDVSYINDKNVMEIITESSGKEEVELFELYDFASSTGEGIAELVSEQLEVTKYRAVAEEMPDINDMRVILRGMDIKELLHYYVTKSNVQAIYDKISDYSINDILQGDEVVGDKLNITLVPLLEDSTSKVPVDIDGVMLKVVQIIKDGQLLALHGNNQYSSYLGVPATGSISNTVIEGGSLSYEEMTSEAYVEILSFSSFQANPFNGEFGGEIRLAKYFDGNEIKYFTGGALSADIKKVHSDMYLSKEIMQINNYKGPKSLMFKGSIAASK